MRQLFPKLTPSTDLFKKYVAGRVLLALVNAFMVVELLWYSLFCIRWCAFWVVLFWQFLFLWPISLATYIHLYNKEKKWACYIGLKKKHVVIVATLMVLFGSSLVYSLYQANQQVIVFHQQVMLELEDSSDRQLYLIHNTIAPSTLLDVADDIAGVRSGQVYAATFPWRSKVIVHQDNWQKEFTYVRFNEGWKLDGIYRKSEYQNK